MYVPGCYSSAACLENSLAKPWVNLLCLGTKTERVRDTRHHTAAALVIAEDKTLKPSSSKCVISLDVWEQAQGDRPWVAEYQSVHWIR